MSSGYLYAVIFDQGTVKVGMSINDPIFRMRVHSTEGKRWGVKIAKKIAMEFSTNDIEFRELALCGYCERAAQPVGGYEWFFFGDAEKAEISIMGFLKKIEANVFGFVQKRYGPEKKLRDMGFVAAMELIKAGMSAAEAAKRTGMHHNTINRRNEYRDWVIANESGGELMLRAAP